MANLTSKFALFLQELDNDYQRRLSAIPLFQPQRTALWNREQRRLFASVFYHIRGYFINFAWYIANFSQDALVKQLILDNIAEEIGLPNKFSHEMLYARFAKACDVDIKQEIVDQTHLLPFVKEFNRQHLLWLSENQPEHFIALFAAYEKLDNLDYLYLVKLGESLALSQHEIAFFNVHVHVNHFDSAEHLLKNLWENNPEMVKTAFHFIYNHQYKMWCDLSNYLFNQSSEI